MNRNPAPNNHNFHDFLIIATIAITTLAIYWQTASNEFINYDDPIYIINNPFVTQGVTWEGIKWAFSTFHGGNWHPLTWISHMLDIHLWGLSAGRHHLVNVIIHTLTSILLFLFLELATKRRWPSALCAILFAIHPIHVESVAWASERKDVLAALFMMLMLLSYRKQCSSKNRIYQIQTCFFFILGLMAKPMLVTMPLILLLLDLWPLQRIDLRSDPTKTNTHSNTDLLSGNFVHKFSELLYEKTHLFVLSLCCATVTIMAQQTAGAIKTIDSTPLVLRFENAVQSYYSYIFNTVYPLNLTLFYPYPSYITLWETVTTLCVLGFVFALVIQQYKKHPFLLMGWFWYIITLLPVIGLIKVGMQSMADRYMYIPSIGLFIMLSWSLDACCKHKKHPPILIASTVSIIVIFSALSYRQVSFWKDSVTLFSRSIAVTDNNHTAHNYLALAYFKQKKNTLAQIHFDKSLAIAPTSLEALVNLGTLYAKSGNLQKAMDLYQRAILVDDTNPESYNNLANIYLIQRNPQRAIEQYQKALALRPHYREAMLGLAKALETSPQLDKAIQYYQQILRSYPDWAEAYNAMGVFFAKKGEITQASQHFAKAVKLNPAYLQAQNNLAKAQKMSQQEPSFESNNK